MERIQLLDEETINQIAAGEVLEDCASCVKELVENAIDAKATLITVQTEQGGLGSIVVADNGEGMSKEELPLAILRHATSKIRSSSDLIVANSFGFRGEALASIAAVSQLEITSCRGKAAWQLIVNAGKISSIKPVARAQGTTICVKSLFHNVYARAQFQKSISKQTTEIYKVLMRLLLFAEGVGLEWISEGKSRFVIAPHLSLKERILLFQGETFFSQLIPINYAKVPFHLTGFMGDLISHRPNRTHDYLFLNGRFVQNKEIYSMILEGYATRLPERRYPSFVCNLSLPSDLFDRNVHPQKKEVRLKDQERLSQFFLEAIFQLFQPVKKQQTAIVLPALPSRSYEGKYASSLESTKLFEPKEPQKEVCSSFFGKVKLMHQLGAYAIFEKDRALCLISLKRASQFLMEKKLSLLKKKESLESQKLLLPFSYRCSYEEADQLEQQLGELQKYGFSLRMLGKDHFIIEAIATGFTEKSTKEFLDNLGKQKVQKGIEERVKALFFQKRAFIPNTEDQTVYLIEELLKCEPPYELDKGKKIVCEFDDRLMERMFYEN